MVVAPPARPARRLVVIAAVSAGYDIALGLAMLFGRPLLQQAFRVAPPTPALHADLNGLFLLAIGIGYLVACRRPDTWRPYLWIMGPLLKGLGAALFVADHVLRGSPDAFLLFAVTDGTVAALTLWALMTA